MQKRHTTQRETRRPGSASEEGEMREQIANWLRDAYAMERGLEKALEKQSNNEELSAAVRERATVHLQETRRHAENVRDTLQALGSDVSGLKTGVGLAVQATKGMATKFARDERVKDLLDAYAMEHFEIACYTALAAAAEQAGFPEVVKVCEDIIKDEERMAGALRESLPTEVISYLFEAAEK